jgi:hypothetical protein
LSSARLTLARVADWLPALSILLYVTCVVVSFPRLVRGLYWNSDAASAFVIASLYHGHATVLIPRFGFWTSLWWLIATRHVPGHVYIWETTGYVFALATAAVLGWATARVAGRRAGVIAAACAVVVGISALVSLITVNFHTSTPFTAAVLAAYLVVLTRRGSWLLAVAMGVLTALNAASDPLLWVAGVAPFAIAAAVLALMTRRRDIALRAGLVCGIAIAGSFATDWAMRALGFHLIPAGIQLVGLKEAFWNFVKLGKSIALLFGANHFFPGVYPNAPLRYTITVLAFVALGATLFVAVRLVVRRSEPEAAAFACFWAFTAVFVSLAYFLTTIGSGVGASGGVNYVLPLAPAAGAGVGLLTARTATGRIVASLAIALVATTNASLLLQRHGHGLGAQAYGREVIRLLERRRLTHGYAPYWYSQSLSWKSGTREIIAPVRPCALPPVGLCRYRFFTFDSWYEAQPGPTFLIVDPSAGLDYTPPPALGRATEVRRFGPQEVVYIYPRDLIAARVRDRERNPRDRPAG